MQGYNFSDRVRKVLQLAREEAYRLGHGFVAPEHVLLGLVREGEAVAAAVLARAHVELEPLAKAVEATLEPGSPTAMAAAPDIPYTSRAKRVLEFAMTEARELGDTYVGTEHLLLGIAREGHSRAAKELLARGLDVPRLRALSLELRGSDVARESDPGMRLHGTFAMTASAAVLASRAMLVAVVALVVAVAALVLAITRS